MVYHIGKNGAQFGPFDAAQVREQLYTGRIGYDDLIWREGLADWVPVRVEFPPADAPPLPPRTAADVPPAQFASSPAFSNPAAPVAPPALADRSKRLFAVIIDGLVSLLAAGPGAIWMLSTFTTIEQSGRGLQIEDVAGRLAAPILLTLVPVLILLVVQTILLCKDGQTLGKRWLRIRIVRTDGSRADFTHVLFLRSFVMQLLGAIPVVGYIVSVVDTLLIFREDRRCLHDMIAGTIVVEA